MNNFDDFYTSFCKEVTAFCHTYVRVMVTSFFKEHDYVQNCKLWDGLNDSAHAICADLNPYDDPRYVSVSELRRRG